MNVGPPRNSSKGRAVESRLFDWFIPLRDGQRLVLRPFIGWHPKDGRDVYRMNSGS